MRLSVYAHAPPHARLSVDFVSNDGDGEKIEGIFPARFAEKDREIPLSEEADAKSTLRAG